MNSRSARFIAIQVLLTAVLMGVIVVTLLDPKSEVSLFAVNVPGAEGPVADESGPGQDADRGEGGRDGRRESGRGSGDRTRGDAPADGSGGALAPSPAGTAGAGESPPLTRPPAPAGEPPAAADDEPPTAPDDEQYGDTLTRLGDAVD